MDRALVEEITRMVLLKLEQYSKPEVQQINNWSDNSIAKDITPENLPLTNDELSWKNNSMQKINKTGNDSIQLYCPLTEEELKLWANISPSPKFNSVKKSIKENQFQFSPLTNEELKKWAQIASSTIGTNSFEHEIKNECEQVKIFRHH